MLFLEYPKCSTCRRAKKWLDSRGADYTDRHIQTDNPTAEELREWRAKSGLPLRKFFNTSGSRETGCSSNVRCLSRTAGYLSASGKMNGRTRYREKERIYFMG